MDEETSNYDSITEDTPSSSLSREEKWAAALMVGVWLAAMYLLVFQ